MLLILLLVVILINSSYSFQFNNNNRYVSKIRYNKHTNMKMLVEHIDSNWIQLAAQGIAEAGTSPFDKGNNFLIIIIYY